MTCRHLLIIFFAIAGLPSQGQSFIFDDAASFTDFQVQRDESHLVCFYHTVYGSGNTSHYRTIRLNANLELTDTVGYVLPGICTNLGSGQNESYAWHIFHSQLSKKESFITFLVTDKSGSVIGKYEKTAEDFKSFFGDKKIKLDQLRFKNIPTSGKDAATLVLEPGTYDSDGNIKRRGALFAMNIVNGEILWRYAEPVELLRPKAVAGKIVAVAIAPSGTPKVHILDMADGHLARTFSISSNKRERSVLIFEANDSTLLIAGSEYSTNDHSNKHGQFFLSRYNLNGDLLLEKIDTAQRLANERVQFAGGAFSPNGDIVIIGESYKRDASMVVAGTAASIAISILLRSPNVVVPNGQVQNIIQSVVSARLSPEGDVAEYHTFPVKSRKQFSQLLKDDRQVYLRNRDELLWYDLTDLAVAPKVFTTLPPNAEVITFFGNLIAVKNDVKKREIILETISPASESGATDSATEQNN